MAFYLVEATPRADRLDELRECLSAGDFVDIEPFGRTLTHSLTNARRDGERVVWEEEDYCSPPLAEEREAVLDDYFNALEVEPVSRGEGWERIADLPRLFPELTA